MAGPGPRLLILASLVPKLMLGTNEGLRMEGSREGWAWQLLQLCSYEACSPKDSYETSYPTCEALSSNAQLLGCQHLKRVNEEGH